MAQSPNPFGHDPRDLPENKVHRQDILLGLLNILAALVLIYILFYYQPN